MGTNMTKVHYQLLLLMPWIKNCIACWWSEQKAADPERSMRSGWQPRFQNCDMACNIQQVWLSRDALTPYKSPQSIYLSTPLSSYSILFYWAEEEESLLSRISLVWQCSLEKQAEPLSSKWKGSLRWKLPSNQVTDIYLIPSVAGLSLKLPKSTLISLDPSKRWIVMAFNQRRLWFLKTSANTEISACGTVTYSCASVAEDEHAARILTVGGKPGAGSYEEMSWHEFWGKTRPCRG